MIWTVDDDWKNKNGGFVIFLTAFWLKLCPNLWVFETIYGENVFKMQMKILGTAWHWILKKYCDK